MYNEMGRGGYFYVIMRIGRTIGSTHKYTYTEPSSGNHTEFLFKQFSSVDNKETDLRLTQILKFWDSIDIFKQRSLGAKSSSHN